MTIPTEMRRDDRCFIVISDKGHPASFQSLHFHLHAICITVHDGNGMLKVGKMRKLTIDKQKKIAINTMMSQMKYETKYFLLLVKLK